jgi:regulator of chromosome condensation
MNTDFIKRDRLVKIISGDNHTLLLAGKSVYAWGDGHNGQIGRDPESKKLKEQEDLTPYKFGTKDVVDIFTASNHSFLIQAKKAGKVLKGWGLNNFGQLGIGNHDNQWLPQEIEFFRNIPIKYVTGGGEFSMVLTQDNELYTWGRNDQGQCGYENRKAENGEEISVFLTPQRVEFFNGPNKLNKICSSTNFSYAMDTENNQIYSWGMGENYVLANKSDDTVFSPFTVPKTFYKDKTVDQLSLGAQHVVVALLQEETRPQLEFDISVYLQKAQIKPKAERKKRRNILDEINDVAERYTQEEKRSRKSKEGVKVYKETRHQESKKSKSKKPNKR